MFLTLSDIVSGVAIKASGRSNKVFEAGSYSQLVNYAGVAVDYFEEGELQQSTRERLLCVIKGCSNGPSQQNYTHHVDEITVWCFSLWRIFSTV